MSKTRLILCCTFIIAVAAVFTALATLLPDRAYQRYQLLDDTIYAGARLSYERAHFDPRPIDVVILGNSRTGLGLSAPWVEERLAAAGAPTTVVNMSLPGDGRNVQWVLLQQVLETKKPKVVVVAINERPYPWGHDSFRYLAPSGEVWREASLGLYDLRKNLMYLPFRQMKLSFGALAPGVLGLDAEFDPQDYQRRNEAWLARWARSSKAPKQLSRAELLAESKSHESEFDRRSRLPAAVRSLTDADDQIYTDKIVQAANAHGAKVIFIYMPAFHRAGKPHDWARYERLGPIQDNSDLTEQDSLYRDWSHFNPAGTEIVSSRLSAMILDVLGVPARAPPQAQNGSKQS